MATEIFKELTSICPNGVKSGADLRNYSRWRIGGPASYLVEPSTVDEVGAVLKFAKDSGAPLLVIGDASNLLFNDKGVDGIVLRIGRRLSKIAIRENHVFAEAGVWVPMLSRNVCNAGLTGMEHTSGIPGTIGGLVFMNGGSNRHGIGENVVEIRAISKNGVIKRYTQDECEFGYRKSAFQRNSEIILSVLMAFERGKVKDTRQAILRILKSRREKFPLKLPNCGSVFVSDPKMYEIVGPPGKAIEDAGLKGTTIGGAKISELHANFIVNQGGATARDVLSLIALARRAVLDRTGYAMSCEVLYVKPDATLIPADNAH